MSLTLLPTRETEGPLVATPNEAMQKLRIARAKLYELLNAGELESYTEGRSRRITLESISAYVKRRTEAEAQRRGRVA
jgi:excisionase family DNA binding protein